MSDELFFLGIVDQCRHDGPVVGLAVWCRQEANHKVE